MQSGTIPRGYRTSFVVLFLAFVIPTFPTTVIANRPIKKHCAASYGNQRQVFHSPNLSGTKNWHLVNDNDDATTFNPRHSHATSVFKCPEKSEEKQCVFLTGGWSDSHRTFDLELENENYDVSYSKDGATWHQVTELFGDYRQGIGNWDAKPGSYVAPWYSRYAHSLNALDGDGDGTADVMVLAGGFNPEPSNDVWITTDGITWYFDGFAPWTKRAYHGATVFQDMLWILGGTPLSNDVWSGKLVKDSTRNAGFRIDWEEVLPNHVAPWSPR